MIDIHCHLIPGVDDGPENEEMVLSMGREAMKEGITHIVATPHHRNRAWDNPKASVVKNVELINELFAIENINVIVLPGQEPRIFGEMALPESEEELVTVNETGSYILVEFPTQNVPRYAEQLFFDLQVKGITPIIVHPERNQEIFDHPEVLYNLVKNGALSQITAASLIGKNGKKVKKLTMQMVEHGLTHVLASDSHNTTKRPFYMREAYLELEKSFGGETVYLFQENAELIVDGKMVNREEPNRIREKKFLGIF
ncbi:tyrosine protein phosphatase [Terrilactibacillus sp. BCM23-1]|uniref:Tyrosine-protein phosphatase n=1 Tax=Terrilactibacillus tamarindi TaxID=2599694 RepID=A0A6N8CPQ3_9BACI|nr:CpsB/CapC family capsule biosynthesis tyrosine phosphatase [Terrilactibacillus tamarindi]MTT32154.1 tyrosine protein phosphatase [Terrilactibacillus tamarindi]